MGLTTLENNQVVIVDNGHLEATTLIRFDKANSKLGFYNTTPVVQASALTVALTDLTPNAPGTPDYAIQALTNSTPYGFVTADEGETVLKIVQANKVRIAEIATALANLGITA